MEVSKTSLSIHLVAFTMIHIQDLEINKGEFLFLINSLTRRTGKKRKCYI
jgi:hypothetical protein